MVATLAVVGVRELMMGVVAAERQENCARMRYERLVLRGMVLHH